MAARATGSGTIAFGMVAIPVKLFNATSATEAIRFNQLHSTCKSRIKQKNHCPTCDAEVERDDLVKGYEFSKDKYVVFEAEELARLDEESSGSIEISEFVPLADVDPMYFEKSYFLGPDKGAARPYHLLAQAMRQTGLCAIARFANRGKDYLILLRPVEQGIIMQQLYHEWEVRSFDEVPVDAAEVKEGELKLATALIQQIRAEKFEPSKYKDAVRERVLALIEKKVEGQEITETKAEAPKAQVIDLMSALKASLGESAAEDAAPLEAKPAKKKSAKSAAES